MFIQKLLLQLIVSRGHCVYNEWNKTNRRNENVKTIISVIWILFWSSISHELEVLPQNQFHYIAISRHIIFNDWVQKIKKQKKHIAQRSKAHILTINRSHSRIRRLAKFGRCTIDCCKVFETALCKGIFSVKNEIHHWKTIGQRVCEW